MNDAEREFDSLLKGMEKEVLDLKTAHQRPLGVLNFFKQSVSIPVSLIYMYGIYSANILLTVEVEPANKPPIVQCGWDIPNGFNQVFSYGITVSFDYSQWTYDLTIDSINISSTTLNVGVISSQPIKNISWSVS